jgi:isoquinoline 1-oxidoreductase beta subunit
MLTRRGFLAGVGAGLVIVHVRAGAAADDTSWQPNPYLMIDTKGQVTIWCHRSEMGQGIRGSLPVLIADELGSDPAKIHLVQGDGDEKYGDQDTDGSSSIRRPYDTVRKAAATARAMLITAAARKWKVPEARLIAHDDAIHDGARALPFSALVTAAAKLPVPKDVVLRPIAELVHVGKQLPARDADLVATGAAQYGADVRLPGMLTAVVARPPVLFGTAANVDKTRTLATPGVRAVVELPAPKPPINMQPLGGVAVIAEHTWAAIRGRAALEVTWDHGANASHDTAAYTEQLRAAVRAPGAVVRKVGDAEAALAKAATLVEAEYTGAYLAHAPMEPPAAIAKVDGNKVEIWAPTQSPVDMRDQVAESLGVAKTDVTVHVTLLGGAFGRKSFPDFAVEAALLAREAKAPVRVQWTRDDDLRHSSYHTHSVQALAAGLDDKGKIVAWRHRVAYPSIRSTFNPAADAPGPSEVGMGVTDMPLAVPNISVETGKAPAHMRIGWLRSVCNIPQAFATYSFIDEIAHAAKRDPRAMLVELVGPPRILTAEGQGIAELKSNYGNSLDKTPHDVARLHRVIDKVSEMAGWDSRGKRALGIAAHSSFASWVAVVAEVSRGKRGELHVDEAWIAADCGVVVNPDRVRYQMEGAFVFALSNALHGAITVEKGAVVERNFHDYRLLRMPEAPRAIHVELIASDAYPGGAGEPGVPPVAPAVANAWFALTGTRLRSMPF